MGVCYDAAPQPSTLLSMRLLCVLLLLLAPPFAWADTLWLKNGDRLTGKILYMDGTAVAFKSKVAGEVRIKRKKIRSLSSSIPLQVSVGVPARVVVSRIRDGADHGLLLDDGTAVSLDDLNRLVRPHHSNQDWQWEGHLDLGLDLHKEPGEETHNVHSKFDTRVFNLNWRHEARADYEYETEDNETSERNYEVEYSVDYFFHRPWFARLHTRYIRDYFEQDRRDLGIGVGPGYQFWDTSQGRFSIDLQAVRYRLAFDFRLDDLSEPVVFLLHAVGLGWDFQHEWLTPELELFANGQILHPQEYDIDHVTRSESGIRYHLNGHINLTLRMDYDQFKQDDTTSTERRYLLGLGVKW